MIKATTVPMRFKHFFYAISKLLMKTDYFWNVGDILAVDKKRYLLHFFLFHRLFYRILIDGTDKIAKIWKKILNFDWVMFITRKFILRINCHIWRKSHNPIEPTIWQISEKGCLYFQLAFVSISSIFGRKFTVWSKKNPFFFSTSLPNEAQTSRSKAIHCD